MARGSLFADLESKHNAARTARRAANIRCVARALAARHALNVPEWAAIKPRVLADHDPAPAPLAHPPSPENTAEAPALLAAPVSPESMAEALAALQSWRRADHSRVLAARADGSVTLIDLSGGKSRRFASYPTANAAKAAIEQDSVAWRTARLETGSWGRPAFAT